jgi:cell division protein FtsI/penicillin-binding protein 2
MNGRIPEKATRVLNIILFAFLLILIRVWYLGIVQHEEHEEKARKPRRKSVIEKVERGTIRDRFNIPLAINKIQYNAAVCYADIRQIPSTKWVTGPDGKRARVQTRLAYIQELSKFLAQELSIDPELIEDTIHAKASLFPHTPFVIKEDISEEQYYKLRAFEKDWAGIRAERGSRRYYPLGKVGGDIIGYMGAISAREYAQTAQELATLQAYLKEREAGETPMLPKDFNNPLDVRKRLKVIEEKAYTINDFVGKTGIEGYFDAALRGYAGRTTYEIDTKGNTLRELPGARKRLSGQRHLLSISAELQQFAEELLIDHEAERQLLHFNGEADLSAPWIKGGAIVAMDPRTGEVLALASYPRIDPNDFIPSGFSSEKMHKQSNINQALENESYIAELWDGKRPLERERWDRQKKRVYTETLSLSWDKYIEAILPRSADAAEALHKIPSAASALFLQHALSELLNLSGQSHVPTLIDALYREGAIPSRFNTSSESKNALLKELSKQDRSDLRRYVDSILSSVKHNDDKLLVIDLCRLVISKEHTPLSSLDSLNRITLGKYRELTQAACALKEFLQTRTKARFHANEFREYRQTHFKTVLKEKRREEKEKRKYAKPYTEYLDQLEKEQFALFWESHKEALLWNLVFKEDPLILPAHIATCSAQLKRFLESLEEKEQRILLSSFRPFSELNDPLWGKYRSLRHSLNQSGRVQLQKHLAAAFYPLSGYGYGRSQAYRQSTPLGSVFKIVIAYQALIEKFQQIKNEQATFNALNPLTLVDNLQGHPQKGSPHQVLGFTLDGKPIKRLYKGGFLPRSSHPHIGTIDLMGALERSSNFYFSLLASDHIHDPADLIDTSRQLGFGEKTGIELTGEIRGCLPTDLSYNRSGLYSFAIGQHSLVVTPLQTAVMLSALANKGEILKPKIVQVVAGEESLREYQNPFDQTQYPFQHLLSSVGIHFPLFTATVSEPNLPRVWCDSKEVKGHLLLPPAVRRPLLDALDRVVTGEKGTARAHIIRLFSSHPEWVQNYYDLQHQFVAKTSTAEILYKQTIDAASKAKIANHIGCAGIAFSEHDHQTWEHPELVVVVYLKFSDAGGKEAAPLATQIVKKWRDIQKKQGTALTQ